MYFIIKNNMKRSHLYHMINPAPWPILVAIILLNVIVGLILSINKYSCGISIFLIGIILILITIDMWFRDIVRESTMEGKHSSIVQRGLKLGMLLFIVSEVMFFFSFFWGYFHYALSPSIEIGCIWPPYGIQAFEYLHIPLYNTMVLLSSGIAVTWCHKEIIRLKFFSNLKFSIKSVALWGGNFSYKLYYNFISEEIIKNVKVYISLILTLILAIHFTYWQVKEYIMSSFSIADSVYGSIFFMATGFHGFHVLLGTFFLGVCFFRLINYHFTVNHHLGLEFAIWYWHFVDVVWIFLFIVIYYGSKI